MKRKIAILGSTGSIGTQTLDVIRQHRDLFEVELLCERVAMINKGQIVLEGTPQELLEKYQCNNLEEVFMQVVRS